MTVKIEKVRLNYQLLRSFSLIVVFISILSLCCASEHVMKIVKTEEGYQFYENDVPILFYRTQPLTTPEGTYSRADYCHPVYGINGEIMTEDFPEDHLHHRGIFWAWHQVYIGDQLIRDMWECKDFIWDIHQVTTNDSEGKSSSLTAKVYWKSPQWQESRVPFAEETVTIRLYKTENQVRMIDFDIQIEALVERFQIGGSDDDKGYGGFSTRIPLPDDLQMTDRDGDVMPQRIAVTAGDWINFSGSFAEQKSDFALLIHPLNPGTPRQWILRKEGSCQNVAYPGREPVLIPMDKPLILRYRVVLHKEANLNKLYADYSLK